MKATKGSQHLIITLAKQHGFCVRLCCLLTLHCSICLHILQTQIPCLFCSFRIVVLMLVSTGFFSLFFRKKTTYNESNMIKNGTIVLDNYCEDILNQSWLKRRKKNSFFRLIHMLNIKCCEFQPIIYLSFVEADVIPFVEFYRFIFGHSVRWVANVIDEKFLAKLATIRTFCLPASLSVFSSS